MYTDTVVHVYYLTLQYTVSGIKLHVGYQTPHSGYVTLCYLNHCQHKNHVTMLYHVIDSKLQPLFTNLLTAITSREVITAGFKV